MIKLKDITIKYGDFVAMEDLALNIKEGEFFSFLGPSGSGKTTILRSITGFVQPSEGDIYIEDQNITNLPIEKRGIGIVFQSYALFPTMNVYENIAYGLRVRKEKKEEIHNKVLEIAKKIDLDESHLYKKVTELSGGQQQRVAIARAMITKPKILCLDEPLSNLDAKLRQKLRSELKALQREFGITTIYVTHDQEEALTLSDRIAVFDNGLLHQVGTPEEIYNNPKTEFVANFIGEVNKLDPVKFAKDTKYENLNKDTNVYLLIHEISDIPIKDGLSLDGNIIAKEYFGYYIKYTLETKNKLQVNFIKFIGPGNPNHYNINDKTRLYVDKKSIKQYSGNDLANG